MGKEIIGCSILLGIGLLLFLVLFPMSFSYLDFYEVNFRLNNLIYYKKDIK
jgi:hypothetical protein